MLKPLLVFLLNVSFCLSEDSYREELIIEPVGSLNGGGRHISATFKFTTLSSPDSHPHYDLFPRAIGELLKTHSIREVSLSLSRGLWRMDRWGYSPFSSPIGATVSAYFDSEDVDENWTKLTNALSGQFCASLNFMDSTKTVSPEYTYQPSGVIGLNEKYNFTSKFRIGNLPGENVCTENLTPWKKLLPCESKRGLATLLNARHVQDSAYHSLGLNVRPVCGDSDCSHSLLELTQYVVLVFDIEAKDSSDWSIRSLFGIGLLSVCPLALSTEIFIRETSDMKISGELHHEILPNGFKMYDVSKLVERGHGNIISHYVSTKTLPAKPPSPPSLSANRYVTGHGQEKGGVTTRIVNRLTEPISIVLLEVIPWYLRLYLHTLRIKDMSGTVIEPKFIKYSPGADRSKPYVLEAVIELPPSSQVFVSINFEHSLLKWSEYPPDANKGFYVGSSVISAVLPDSRNISSCSRKYSTYKETIINFDLAEESVVRIFTESLLVSLPTPDFSMPYNVICLACTVIALAFGPLHNITTKKIVQEPQGDPLPKKVIKKVISTIKSFI